MAVVLVVVALVLLAAAAAVQLALPRVAERRIAARLTEYGGEARVRVRARPATRLLRNAGERIEVRGRGLEITMAPARTRESGSATATAGDEAGPGRTGLSALDGFAAVDIELVDFRTGPFAVDAFVLDRRAGGSYAMAVRAQTTAAELAALGLEALPGIPGGALLGSVAGAAPLGSRSFAVSLEIELISASGGLSVGAGGGTIAGYPAGPLAATIAAAVARRLEFVP